MKEEIKDLWDSIDYLCEELRRLKKRVYDIETGDV